MGILRKIFKPRIFEHANPSDDVITDGVSYEEEFDSYSEMYLREAREGLLDAIYSARREGDIERVREIARHLERLDHYVANEYGTARFGKRDKTC